MASAPFARPAYEITTPRLTLRTARESDTEAFYDLLADPRNFPYERPEPGLTPDKLRARIGRFASAAAAGENAFLVFALRDTGELVGHGGYNTFEPAEPARFLGAADAPAGETRMTDVGIMLDHRHWRRGFGLEILCALVEFARGELGCGLFRAETGDDNEPWRGLMRRAGLGAFEGRHKASYDENLEVWVWTWDVGRWEQAKEKLLVEERWPL